MATKDTDRDSLRRLAESLDRDVLEKDDLPDSEVDSMIRDRGGDPNAIATRGVALVEELRRKRRLSWMETARAKGASMKTAVGQVSRKDWGSRTAMLSAIQGARSDPQLGQQVRAMYSKRKPEAASDDELRSMLDDIEALRAIASTTKGKTDK